MAKKYAHYVKKIVLREGPEGLYPKPLFWMEGKDLEGFNGHICYSFVTEPSVFHPMQGMIVHPYDELLVFAGLTRRDILFLGGEVSIEIGAEREEYVFTEPTVVCIPKGTPHGPVKVRRVYKEFAHYTIGLAANYEAVAFDPAAADSAAAEQAAAEAKTDGKKYAHLIKKLRTYSEFREGIDSIVDPSGMGYRMCTDENGVMHPIKNGIGPGNADELVWMFGENLENFEVNFTWGHYTQAGKWHRDGETHTHPEEEILCFFPADPALPHELGCEIEFGLGAERERQIFKEPSIIVCPKAFPHLPQITRWCDRMYIFVVVCLSATHDSPWIEVDEACS